MARHDESLAPWPLIDRYPIIVGQGLSLGYLGQIFKLALTGYRREYVDLLDELLEKEPHGYAVLAKRIETIACAKVEIVPPEGVKKSEQNQADEYAQCAKEQILALPSLTQRLASLFWAEYYGVGALESHWEPEGKGWSVIDTTFIHSRRISYPNQSDWSPHIWDLGPVGAIGTTPFGKTQGAFGLRMRDYPGKFIVHAPQLRGDYPTREGIGRQIAVWIVLKLIASRGASVYLERFAKPLIEGTFNSLESIANANPRIPKDDELDDAKAALSAWASGSNAWWLHSDAIKANLLTPDGQGTGKITFADWIALCDSQMSKAALSATLTTEVGKSGSRAVADTQKEGEDKRFEFSASMGADTIKRDLADWIVNLNFANPPRRLLPRVLLRMGEDPDPMSVLKKAGEGAKNGIPVDADAIADEVGLPVIPKKEGDPPRRMFPLLGAKLSPPPEVIGLPEAEPEDEEGGDQPNAAGKKPSDDSKTDKGDEPEPNEES